MKFLRADIVNGVTEIDKGDMPETFREDEDFYEKLSATGEDEMFGQVSDEVFLKIEKEYGINRTV